jgi:hypothetical protein
MSKFVFVSLASAWILTVAGVAQGVAPSADLVGSVPRIAKQMVRVVKVPAPTWTCEHNTYRSVACE